FWLSCGPNWKHCRPPRVPDQVGQEAAGVVVAQGGTVRQAAVVDRGPAGKLHPPRRKEMAVDAGARDLGKPGVGILEHRGETLEEGVGGGGAALVPFPVRKARLHVKPRAARGATLDRLGEKPVDLAGVWLGPRFVPRIRGQEGIVKPVRLRPDLAGDE